MDETLQTQLALIGDDVRAGAIPADDKQTALWCMGQLPALYLHLRETSESRFGDEIARLVQLMMKTLVRAKKASPEVESLAAGIPARLRQIHEQLGLPELTLKTPRVPASAARKR